jgi:NADH-quinone oxidoreductase subunit N
MFIGVAVAYHFKVAPPSLPLEQTGGVAAVLFYLVAYGAMTVGAFAVIQYLSTPERPVESEDDLAGLGQTHPGVALLMTLFLFSLIGIPLTAGFWGKWMLFWGAMALEGPNAWLFRLLAVFLAVNAAIGGWYYVRILAKMYLYPSAQGTAAPRSVPGLAALWICAIVTLGLFVYPDLLLDETKAIANPTTQVPQQARLP